MNLTNDFESVLTRKAVTKWIEKMSPATVIYFASKMNGQVSRDSLYLKEHGLPLDSVIKD